MILRNYGILIYNTSSYEKMIIFIVVGTFKLYINIKTYAALLAAPRFFLVWLALRP
jgi:hypothetical protein